jgi:nitrogen fixation NifU-like protein
MDDVLYRDEILDRYRAAPLRGRLDAPDWQAELDNPLCGDRVRLELERGPENRVGRARFDGYGCAISQVAASLLAEHVEGKPLDELRSLSADDALGLLGIRLTPGRVKCGLLAWRVLHQALASGPESLRSSSKVVPIRQQEEGDAS